MFMIVSNKNVNENNFTKNAEHFIERNKSGLVETL